MKNVTPVQEIKALRAKKHIPQPKPEQRNFSRGSNNKYGTETGDETRTKRGLELIHSKSDEEIAEDIELKAAGRRVQYMPMKVHQEKAAMALAAGLNQKAAAKFAGIHPRQIRKYMQNIDFRERIVEHRQVTMSQIQGKLLKEVMRRVGKDNIQSLEPLDLVRFYNMTTGGKDKGLSDGVTINVKYDQTFNAIVTALEATNSEGEGGDFPEYGPQDLLLPGADSSGD